MSLHPSFSDSYAEARGKFLEAATAARLSVTSHELPLKGRDGETLAMDVVLDGPRDARHMLVVSSGCHGVEGYCGSGVQVRALQDGAWRAHAAEHGVAVLYIHALNPYGFSHLRRVTHENVDLNRNFHDFSQPLPANPVYAELNDWLLPPTWPPGPDVQAAIERFIAERGMLAFQTAISSGQHDFPGGMFFGGREPTWSNRTVRKVLRDWCGSARRLGWIDVHTGLGPSGVGERISACKNDPVALQRVRAWWGDKATSIYDGSSTSAVITGMMWGCVEQECPQAEYTGIAIEYGTKPLLEVMHAMRGDHWLHLHPEASPQLVRPLKQTLLDAFYVNTDVWKTQILTQAREALFQAVDGLSGA